MHLTLVANELTPVYEIPAEEDIAWAEHAERDRITRGYWTALEARDLNTAWDYRQQAVAYDRANPESSSLVAELVALRAVA